VVAVEELSPTKAKGTVLRGDGPIPLVDVWHGGRTNWPDRLKREGNG